MKCMSCKGTGWTYAASSVGPHAKGAKVRCAGCGGSGHIIGGAPMITREEADALLDRMSGPEGAGLRDVARAPDLARTVVALYDERDALALELRRLRAAEAPGTDDEAFSGTGWASSGAQAWVHESGAYIAINIMGSWVWSFGPNATDYLTFAIALDAMRAAVPGSV